MLFFGPMPDDLKLFSVSKKRKKNPEERDGKCTKDIGRVIVIERDR